MMSAAKRLMEQKASKGRQRRYGATTKTATKADWRIIDNANILNLIQGASEVGGALRFGLSRDGGAYALGVYGDGPDVYTVYAGSREEMDEHILRLTDVFEAIAIEEGIEPTELP